MSDNTIAVIDKNAREEIRVALREFKGHRLVDARVYADRRDGPGRVATAKGVSLAVEKLPELAEALRLAVQEARRAGLIGGEATPRVGRG